MQFIYVSGPLTQGDRDANVEAAVFAADNLRKLGYTPFVPHTMTQQWGELCKHDEDYWLALDLEWLSKCDGLLRLPGFSPGGDVEVAFAERHNIPVFHDLHQLMHQSGATSIANLPTLEG